MGWLAKFTEEIKKKPLSVVFSEGEDERIVAAAHQIEQQGLASAIYLIGDQEVIGKIIEKNKFTFTQTEIIDPKTSPLKENYAKRLMELKPQDYPELDSALQATEHRLYFGSLLHESGKADLHITGAVETSSDVIKAFFHIIKTNRREGIATSFFFMESDNQSMGEKGAMLFADCAVNIDPGAKQLARIAYQTGNIASTVFGFQTKLNLLSYSTKGSGHGEQVEHILNAQAELEKLTPEFIWEAEMQADAAIVPEVSDRKAPGNKTGGKANVLIFPDLQAGNIGYKLVERFGNTRAYGPVIIGLNKVASDLSRGCDSESIVGTFLTAGYYLLKKPAPASPKKD